MNWNEIFDYDETSPTFLRWKDKYRLGKGGKPVRRTKDAQAGSLSVDGRPTLSYGGKLYSVNQIVWEMFNGAIPENRSVMFIDGDSGNCKISNLELNIEYEVEHKYGSYLDLFFVYDETSPSCLRWKRTAAKGSNAKPGDPAGSLDNGYWKLNCLGKSLKGHKVVWALHNNFENQDGLFIDHIDRNPSNNKVENLRLIQREFNSRNRSKNKNNVSGVTGVSYQEFYNERGTLIRRYVATINKGDKKRGIGASKSFSAEKWGDEKALQMAAEWRQKEIERLNSLGFGYTENHGL